VDGIFAASMKEIIQGPISRRLVFVQALIGAAVYAVLALPYLRRAQGMEKLRPGQNYLFVANHVSLLDSILLGALCWRSGIYPILVLADKKVWQASWIRRLLSRNTSFLLERGRLNPSGIRDLQAFGRAGKNFQLIVFPEGTRGDGVNVAECRPGIYFIAHAAQLPLVPVFFENMQHVSTKHGRFHPLGGLRKVEVHFGEPVPPEKYLALPRAEFLKFVQRSITAARRPRPAFIGAKIPRPAAPLG
jgi:1-acyl-sn-glycerol-3-phosphate acyltransferase